MSQAKCPNKPNSIFGLLEKRVVLVICCLCSVLILNGGKLLYKNKESAIIAEMNAMPCTMNSDEIGGKVYREFKFNGTKDSESIYRFEELGIADITVNIYDDNGVLLNTTTSDVNGDWSATVNSSSTDRVLLEFVSIDGFESGPSGSDNATSVQIGTLGTCDNDFTVGKTGDHCQDNPTIVTACFPGPFGGGPNSTLVTIEFEESDFYASTSDQNSYPPEVYTGATAATDAAIANESETGFINGVAWDRMHQQILSASTTKLSPVATFNNIGKVYTTNPSGGTTLWLDLESIFPNAAGSSAFENGRLDEGFGPGLYPDPNDDPDVHNIGHIGFSDIEINDDNSEVYLFNAFDRSVYIIKIDSITGQAITTGIRKVDIPALCAGTNGNGYSYSVAGALGYLNGRLYASTTCTGPNVSDLQGAVYSFDVDAATPTLVQEFTIDYSNWEMPGVFVGGISGFTDDTYLNNVLAPWSEGLSNVNRFTQSSTFPFPWIPGTGFSDFAPWAYDIEFDIHPNGDIGMNLITKNRATDAVVELNDPTNGGYLTKASLNDDGSWELESDGDTGPFQTGLNKTVPADPIINIFQRGQPEASFYHGEGLEGPGANGGGVVIPGFKEFMSAYTDNYYGNFDSGFSFHNVKDGLKSRDVNILLGGNVGFGKGNSWGDLQAMCEMPPMEIGNYVWIDEDRDGFQDPSEDAIAGIEVQLFKDTNDDGIGDLFLGTATTDTRGYYFFGGSNQANTSQKIVPFMTYELRISLTQTQGVDARIEAFTINDNVVESFDSDYKDTTIATAEWAAVKFSTTDEQMVYHQFDAGVVLTPEVNINDVDVTCGPLAEGGSMSVEVNYFVGTPLTYDWNEDAYDGLSEVQNVPLGTYTVTVTDPMGNMATASASITVEACLPDPCVAGQMGGTVFNDPDADGIDNSNQGFQGIKVQIFGCGMNGTSELLETVYTDVNGDYHFTNPIIQDGEDYRIEFSGLPNGYTSSITGVDNGSETQFVDAISCDINYGIFNPTTFCSEDPLVAAVCFARNNDPTTEPTIIFVKTSDSRAWPGPQNSTDNNGNWGIPSGSNASNYPLTYLEAANVSEVNTTLGMDFDILNSRLITGSYMRAYAPMNTNGSANGYAEAALYQIPVDLENISAGNPSLWLDLEDLFGDDFAGTYLPDLTFPGPAVFGRSGSNPDLIGYTGLGSIKISKDRSELYTVNLATREVLVIPIGKDGAAPTLASEIKRFPLPETSCSGTWGDGRDLRAVLGLGVHPESGRVYATMTCTGPTFADVTGYVYSLDPSDNSPSSTDFTLELSIPLDIKRPATSPNSSRFWNQTGHAWESVTANTVFYTNDPRGVFGLPNELNVQHNMPWLGEIEFGLKDDGNYSMIIAERNRYHDQISTSWYVTGGVIFKACGDEGNWILSSGNSCGTETSVVNFSYGGTNAGVYTDDGNRYMMYVGREGSMGSGFMTLGQDGKTVVSPVMDNLFNSATSGLTWVNYTDGGRERDIRILGDYTGGGYNETNFTKANNWGAIASMCGLAPIQLGNYVWLDLNADGIQDPCEPAVSDLTVKLYTKPSNADTAKLVATTVTNSDGEYYFSNDSDIDEAWEEGFSEIEKDSSYFIVFCGDGYNDESNVVLIDGSSFAISVANQGMGQNPDFNDSDASEFSINNIGDLPAICVVADSVNHTFDVGLVPKPDVAVIQELDPEYDASNLAFGDSVKFKITVFNQGLSPIDSIKLVDYLPQGYTFNSSIATNPLWEVNTDGNPIITLEETIAPGEKDSTCIYLTLEKTDDVLEWINVVEISAAYEQGVAITDCDSPLNDDPSDNVGSNINTPADDYINGDGSASGPDGVAETDQDNVDPATVPICDLALINKIEDLASSLQIGDTIKYSIIIENQGTVPATEIDIAYSIPAGLTYASINDVAPQSWINASDTAATTTIKKIISPGDKDTICLYLILDHVDLSMAGEDAWTTFAEISAFEDPNFPGVDKSDLDSNPDNDPTNDPGGNPDDDTDNETGGDGSGDPDDPTEDMDPSKDEDDHDPAKIEICDAALTIATSDDGPHSYGDTIKYVVTIYNQGNGPITNVSIKDQLGDGLAFVATPGNDGVGWDETDGLVSVTISDEIAAGDSEEYCLELLVQMDATPSETSWLQVAEITKFEDPESPGVAKEDIDSTPDDNLTNDPGGNPDDSTDDVVDGDGSGDPNNPMDDEDPSKDEDDHDPVDIEICDAALTNKIVSDISDLSPGDTVKFEVVVYNQGNTIMNGASVAYHIPNGFGYLESNDDLNPMWSSSVDELATITTTDVLSPGASDTVCIYLELMNLSGGTSTPESWTTIAEITSTLDENNDVKTEDVDSSPDNDPTNDPGGNPDDDTDNETGGDGSGDPEDPTEDMDPSKDEDDHDPAMIEICDAALTIATSDDGPHSYGDTIKYVVTIYNQGNGPITNVSIKDQLGDGLAFVATPGNDGVGWDETDGLVSVTISDEIAAGDSEEYCLELLVQMDATPSETSWLQVAEITKFEDPESPGVAKEDIDSTPDDNLTNDPGGNPDDATDDVVDGDGSGDPNNPMDDEDPSKDEDDHDPVDIEICDLALINQIVEIADEVKEGDTIKYEVVIFNQGNRPANTTNIIYDIPIGLSYVDTNDDLSPGWSEENQQTATTTLDRVVLPGESDTVCLYLQLENVPVDLVTESSWTTFAEISSYTNGDDEVKLFDADSTPDDDSTNDPGGNPDDDTDDEIGGDGSGDPDDPMEDMDPSKDEDDHDPTDIEICDAAITIKSVKDDFCTYGDTVKYVVTIYNQGNGSLTNFEVHNTFGSGLNYIDLPGDIDEGWNLENEGLLSFTYDNEIAIGMSDSVCLFMIVMPEMDNSEDSWLQQVEIVSFEDPTQPGLPKVDIDSTPDDDPNNDSGGNPDDETDDEIDGDGDGDPTDPIDDMDPELDEDDHDPEDVQVFDLALKKRFAFPDSIYRNGDIIEMIYTLFNQGNVTSSSISIIDYVPPSLDVVMTENEDLGWTMTTDGNATYNHDIELAPGDSVNLTFYGRFVIPATGGSRMDFINYGEIYNAVDDQGNEIATGDMFDADSNADNINLNDAGGAVGTDSDDAIFGIGTNGNGMSGSEDPNLDEDDQDPLQLAYVDLALTKKLQGPLTPVKVGDTATFVITVLNQGLIPMKEIVISDYIPEGFALADDAWMELNSNLAQYTIGEILQPRTSKEVLVSLEVLPVAQPSNLVNEAEITSFKYESDADATSDDIDSQGDDIVGNDPGGLLYSMNDDFVDGDGNSGGGSPYDDVTLSDEDDHDPGTVQVFDLALTKQLVSPLGPLVPDDVVTFDLNIYNQGNIEAHDIVITDLIPDGYVYNVASDALGWEFFSDSNSARITFEGPILREESATIQIILTVAAGVTSENVTNVAEITRVFDENGNDLSDADLDSQPGDEEGGGMSQIGTGDDDNPNSNGNVGDAQDDSDPALISILDLALRKTVNVEDAVIPGQIVEYEIEVFNQGTMDAHGVSVTDFLPEGLGFVSDHEGNENWVADGQQITTSIDTLLVDSSEVLTIYIEVLPNANPDNLLNRAEIVDVDIAVDMNGEEYSDPNDIDSEANDDPTDDNGSEEYSVLDDVIDQKSNLGGDEDDNDQAHLVICHSMSCIDNVNVSLNEACETILTPSMILSGIVFPDEFYEFKIKDKYGEDHANFFDQTDAGEFFTVSVFLPACGTTCWGTVNIENKNTPSLETSTTEVMCNQPIPNFESLEDIIDRINNGCNLPITDVSQTLNKDGDGCGGFLTIRTISGSVSLEGTKRNVVLRIDTIRELPLTLDMVTCPLGGPTQSEGIKLSCNDTEGNYPEPTLIADLVGAAYAYPYIENGLDTTIVTRDSTYQIERSAEEKILVIDDNGNEIWIVETVIRKIDTTVVLIDTLIQPLLGLFEEGVTCNVSVKYTDATYEGCAGSESKILRTWSILDWCTGEIKECLQWIVIETDGPQIEEVMGEEAGVVTNVNVTIAPWTCAGELNLEAVVIGQCNSNVTIAWSSTAGVIGEDNVLRGLWLGEDAIVTLTAIDDCGQVATYEFAVTPIDNIIPVPVAEDELNVSLTSDETGTVSPDGGVGKVLVDAVDAGSHNAGCGEVDKCLLLKEEFENPVIIDGVHVIVDGNLVYHASGCRIDGTILGRPATKTSPEIPDIDYVYCKEFVKFCCADIGRQEVALIVENSGGQTAHTWSVINVEDKSAASFTCAIGTTLACGEAYDPMDFKPGFNASICSDIDLNFTIVSDIDGCGKGNDVISWFVDSSFVCETLITFEGESAFDPYEIKWPKHFTGDDVLGIRRECEEDVIVEYTDNVSMGNVFDCLADEDTGIPVWCEANCSLIGVTHEPLEIDASDACKKVILRWTLIDWCNWNPNTANLDEDHDDTDSFEAVDDTWLGSGNWLTNSQTTNGEACEVCDKTNDDSDHVYFRYTEVDEDGYYTYDQVIKIVDETPPMIEVVQNVEISISSGANSKTDSFDDCVGQGVVTARVSDMCGVVELSSNDAAWIVEVWQSNSDGEKLGIAPLEVFNEFGEEVSASTLQGSSGTFHLLAWSVTDGCNNIGKGRTLVSFIDDKKPTPICIQDLSTALMTSTGTVEIWASDYDNGSFDNCSEVNHWFLLDDRGYPSTDEETGTFSRNLEVTCDILSEIGEGEILTLRLYVIDSRGNIDYCNITLSINGSADFCDEVNIGAALIAGETRTRFDDKIQGVEVLLNVGSKDLTNQDGGYAFANNALARNYQINAVKNDDYSNGVSTIDMVYIQRHLLGLELIENPYDLIAADVNSDGRISVTDLFEIRKLILGLSSKFANNGSWRFVDANFKFENESDPFQFKEVLFIDQLKKNEMDHDFIGVKIGDINGDHRANEKNDAESRSEGTLIFEIENKNISKGEMVEIEFTTEEYENLIALQTTFTLDGLEYIGSRSEGIGVADDNFGLISESVLTFAWHSVEQTLINDQSLFAITFRATEDVVLSEALQLGNGVTQSLAYHQFGEVSSIHLDYVEHEEQRGFSLMQNQPNPFVQKTIIGFTLPEPGQATLKFFTVTGMLVHEISGRYPSGYNEVVILKGDIEETGVLYYELQSQEYKAAKKMILLD